MKNKIISVVLSLVLLLSMLIPAYAISDESSEEISVNVVEKNLETNEIEDKIYSSDANGVSEVEVIDSWEDDSQINFDISKPDILMNRTSFLEPYSIIGGSDGRTKVASTKVHPYSAIVYLDIHFGLVSVRGTGFLISDNIVATAAHCLYDSEYGWATSVSVMPGKTGFSVFNDPYGVAAAKRIGVSKQWLASTDSNYDWGTIEIYDSLVGNPGKLNIASLDDANIFDANIKISGYPGEVAGKSTYAQYEMNGTISFCTPYRYYYTIDSSGGQSGAPILDENNVAIGIHTSGSTDFNTGIRFTPDVLYYLNLCISNGVGEYA